MTKLELVEYIDDRIAKILMDCYKNSLQLNSVLILNKIKTELFTLEENSCDDLTK